MTKGNFLEFLAGCLAILMFAACICAWVVILSGCTFTRTAPLIQRNAPLIEIHDTLNGNETTVPLKG